MWAYTVRREPTSEPTLSRAWQLSLIGVEKPQQQRRRRELVRILETMERSGEVFDLMKDLRRMTTVRSVNVARLLELGVVMVGSRALLDGETEGLIRLVPDGISGPIEPDWRTFLEWLRDFLSAQSRQDVRRKLAGTGATERHAFIGASYSSPGEVFFALSMEHAGALPPEPPALPPEVTHVWIWNAQSGQRCLV